MVTKREAETAQEFHQNWPVRLPKTKSGKPSCYVWRRNGKTQTWKTRPQDFRTPVKFGLYEYGQITELSADGYHLEADCPFKSEE